MQTIVEDNGAGFDVDAVRRRQGSVGIFGMNERAELLGGTLAIEQPRWHHGLCGDPAVNKIRILLADDHAVLQAGLEAMLNAEADMTVVGSASDGHSAVRQAALLQPDVVLLDINMPELNGLEALAQLRVRRQPAMC